MPDNIIFALSSDTLACDKCKSTSFTVYQVEQLAYSVSKNGWILKGYPGDSGLVTGIHCDNCGHILFTDNGRVLDVAQQKKRQLV